MCGDLKFEKIEGTIPDICKKLEKRINKDTAGGWGKLISCSDGKIRVRGLTRSLKYFEKLIPKGCYCYTYSKKEKFICCPLWDIKKYKPEQENGYCHLLHRGD